MVSLEFGRLNTQAPKILTFILIVVMVHTKDGHLFERNHYHRSILKMSIFLQTIFIGYTKDVHLSESNHHHKGISGVKAASEKRYREHPSEFKYVP